MNNKIIFFAAVLISFSASGFAWDVAGVAIGVTLSEAKAQIAKANAGLKPSVLSEQGKETGVVATTNVRPASSRFTLSSGADDEFVALTNNGGRSWFVQRIQRPGDSSDLKRDALYSALNEKFGAPSWARFPGFEVVWEFDRSGNRYVNSSKLGAGRTHSARTPCSLEYDRVSRMVPGFSFQVPAALSPTCGILIVASAGLTPDGRVAEYQLRIVDVASSFDELNAGRTPQNSGASSKPAKPNI